MLSTWCLCSANMHARTQACTRTHTRTHKHTHTLTQAYARGQMHDLVCIPTNAMNLSGHSAFMKRTFIQTGSWYHTPFACTSIIEVQGIPLAVNPTILCVPVRFPSASQGTLIHFAILFLRLQCTWCLFILHTLATPPAVRSFYTLLPHHLMSVHPMHSSCTTFNSPDLHSLCPFMHIHDRTMQLACSFINARQGKFIYFACCSFIAPVHANIQDGVESFILLLIHCTCSCVYIRQGGFIYFACCSFIAPVHAYIHDGMDSFILLLIHCTCSCVNARQGGFIYFACCSFVAPVHAYIHDGVGSFILLLIHCTCSCVYIRQGGFINFSCCSFIAPVHAYL